MTSAQVEMAVKAEHARRYKLGCRGGKWGSMCEDCTERLAGATLQRLPLEAETAFDGFAVDGEYEVVAVWVSRCDIVTVSSVSSSNPSFRSEGKPSRTMLHAWMDEVRKADPFQQVAITGCGGRLYILTAPRSMVFIELSGTPQTGYTPRFADDTNPREVETYCDGCGAELSETMTHTTSANDSKSFIICEACGRKYRIRSELQLVEAARS